MEKFYSLIRNNVSTAFLLLVLSSFTLPGFGQVSLRVKPQEKGGAAFNETNIPTSWDIATYDLQAAIDYAAANGGGEIWVAAGSYLPTTDHDPLLPGEGTLPSDNRNKSFTPKNGVTVIGGFAGGESSLDQRPVDLFAGENATILSGDLGVTNDNQDNSYHVVFCPIGTDYTAIVKDLIIAHGNANGYDHMTEASADTIPYSKRGGGLQARGGGTFINCHFTDNYAETLGGGAYLYKGGLLTGCTLYDNSAGESGGGAHIYLGATVTHSTFYHNHATDTGGGAFLGSDVVGDEEEPNLEQSTLSHSIVIANTSDKKGGGVGIKGGGYLINNLIANNESTGNGGGVYLQDGTNDDRLPNKGLVMNNTIVGNKGDNGAGIYSNKAGKLVNNIIWGNQTPYENNHQFTRKEGTTILENCAIEITTEPVIPFTEEEHIIRLTHDNSGEGICPQFINPVSFAGLPTEAQFLEAMNANYHLDLQSPLVNAGKQELTDLPIPETDLSQAPRIIKDIIDIGAYETLYYSVTASVASESGGTITPESANLIPGASHIITITPAAEYKIASFTLNSTEAKDQLIPSNDSFTYTLTNLSEDMEAVVSFSLITTIKQTETEAIRIFPNPTTNSIQIEGNQLQSAEIFSLSGKSVKTLNQQELNGTISVTMLPKGIYFVVITKKDGEKVINKLIKQ